MSEYEATLDGLKIIVDKDGGGTLGRTYDGNWTVTAMNGPEYVFDSDVVYTGTPKTHAQVARIVRDFASTLIDGEA